MSVTRVAFVLSCRGLANLVLARDQSAIDNSGGNWSNHNDITTSDLWIPLLGSDCYRRRVGIVHGLCMGKTR
jgi:hypothetical protein